MKLYYRGELVYDTPVGGALTGYRGDELRFDAEDLVRLAQCSDEQLCAYIRERLCTLMVPKECLKTLLTS